MKQKWLLENRSDFTFFSATEEEALAFIKELAQRRIKEIQRMEGEDYVGDSPEDVYATFLAGNTQAYATAFVGYEGEKEDQESYVTVGIKRADKISTRTME
jgi:hypothetical protein